MLSNITPYTVFVCPGRKRPFAKIENCLNQEINQIYSFCQQQVTIGHIVDSKTLSRGCFRFTLRPRRVEVDQRATSRTHSTRCAKDGLKKSEVKRVERSSFFLE